MASPRSIEDFEVTVTADGSPSLRIADSAGYVEKMHHTDGALSESLYIYGNAIEETLNRGWPLRVLSLGLGLGYNELIVATQALKHHVDPANARLYSFEIEPVLSRNFIAWIHSEESAFSSLYDNILQKLEATFQMAGLKICSWLQDAFKQNQWSIRSRFPDEATDITGISCMLYDAFSNKMSPELWSEEVLTSQLQKQCSNDCVFTTYAATGALNRALRNAGFKKVERRGFSGKRESTLAIRTSTRSLTVELNSKP